MRACSPILDASSFPTAAWPPRTSGPLLSGSPFHTGYARLTPPCLRRRAPDSTSDDVSLHHRWGNRPLKNEARRGRYLLGTDVRPEPGGVLPWRHSR
jgi:hypothetical protein